MGQQTLGMYDIWAETMGGILAVAGIEGFLENLQEFYESADAEGNAWRSFVSEWWEKWREQEVKTADLFALAMDTGMPLEGKTEQAQKVRLGQKIMEARDRVFAIEITGGQRLSFRIEQVGKRQRAILWKLKSECGESR
jgi:putative DNA primase/helicase